MTTWCLLPIVIGYSLAIIFYIVVPIFASDRLTIGKRLSLSGLARLMVGFALLLQILYVVFGFYLRPFPSFRGVSDILALLSIGLGGLFLWTVWRHRWEGLSFLFIPLVFIFFLLSLGQEGTDHFLSKVEPNFWLVGFHVFFALLALFFMVVNFILGLAFWLQDWGLRTKRENALSWNLPPLLLNEKRGLQWLKIGFALLTIVLVTGAMLTGRNRVSPAQMPHVFLALVSWTIYALLLERRWAALGGKKILLLSFLGFVSLAASLLWN